MEAELEHARGDVARLTECRTDMEQAVTDATEEARTVQQKAQELEKELRRNTAEAERQNEVLHEQYAREATAATLERYRAVEVEQQKWEAREARLVEQLDSKRQSLGDTNRDRETTLS